MHCGAGIVQAAIEETSMLFNSLVYAAEQDVAALANTVRHIR